MAEELSEIERLKLEIQKLKEENAKLMAEVERKKGWNPPPFNPYADPDFIPTHEYLGGGMWKKVPRRSK